MCYLYLLHIHEHSSPHQRQSPEKVNNSSLFMVGNSELQPTPFFNSAYIAGNHRKGVRTISPFIYLFLFEVRVSKISLSPQPPCQAPHLFLFIFIFIGPIIVSEGLTISNLNNGMYLVCEFLYDFFALNQPSKCVYAEEYGSSIYCLYDGVPNEE